jgi:outer membrane protein assembly factor BamB
MKSTFLVSILTIIFSYYTIAQDVTQWRGKDRQGIYPDTDLLGEWPEKGPNILLEIDSIGNGYGSPVFANDIMYIMGEVGDMGWLFAFDLKGTLLWKRPYGKEWVKSYPGSRSSPTIVNNLIYTCSGFGELTCYKIHNGEKIWSKHLKNDFKGTFTRHGHSESPLIFEDKVYLCAGGAEHNVVALNRFSGELIWSSPGKDERPGYNTPNIIQLKNRTIMCVFSAYHLMAFDANTGEMLWAHEQTNIKVEDRRPGKGDTHSNTVFYEDDHLWYVAGDGNGAVKLKMSDDGSEITEVWSNPNFDDYMGGPIKLGNYMYAGTTAKKDFKSMNTETGEFVDTLKLGSGAVISADKKLYYYTQKGMLHLIVPKKGKLELKGSVKVHQGSKEHFAHPVIHKGLLYQRHGNVLVVFEI